MQVRATQVSHLDVLEVLPHAFIRVQVGRVSRQLLQLHERRSAIRQKGFDLVAAMNRRTVPHHQQLAANHPLHVTQKRDTLDAPQWPAASQGKELTARRDTTHHRQVVARDKRAQHRRSATGRIGADDSGQQVETRFVNKDGRALLAPRFFFNPGQVSERHSIIFSSSRWAARSIGFCGVQRKAFNNRETWSLWYVTENSRAITCAMRRHVQTSPRKPYASAPCDKNSGISFSCSGVSFGVAPRCGRVCKLMAPCFCTAAIHWLTATFVTPNASAISCCDQPSRLSSSARQRRISFQSGVRAAVLTMPAVVSSTNELSYQCINQ